jgi:hypothetical protein
MGRRRPRRVGRDRRQAAQSTPSVVNLPTVDPHRAWNVRYQFLKTGSTKWTAWTSWLTGASTAGGTFLPTLGSGTYAFISRVRNASTGNISGWSLEAAISAR